ncbi:hypothetical protein ACFQ1E_01570 [Sphingomonas canadensis]|uniref:Uncharacterized protein n=1 Tax=Sphingomonas canadensis TaxID=1219257 RepID=A0ABW3H0T1_9SPHN|nr:hypothetical protein [Sphingomonas canadensis]MCW3835070.1 hypothetical protein [Sphingomonas canadensis]
MDAIYFAARAARHEAMVSRTSHPAARLAHMKLAAAYRAKAEAERCGDAMGGRERLSRLRDRHIRVAVVCASVAPCHHLWLGALGNAV